MRIKSDKTHANLDLTLRRRKARRILSVLDEYCDLAKARVLDIGTGAGVIASEIAARARDVTSVDVSDERLEKSGYEFVPVRCAALPFEDASFDVVISNHVAEHVPDQEKHFQEALRVLRPGGVAYVATPNRFWFTDPHHRLPFVSMLPRGLSDRYVRAVRGREWDIYPLSHRRVRRLLRGAEEIVNGVPVVMRSMLDAAERRTRHRVVANLLASRFASAVQYTSPTLIYIVRK